MPPKSPRPFPALSGEMAQGVASFPWKMHPLGEPEEWPVSLRNAVVLLSGVQNSHVSRMGR